METCNKQVVRDEELALLLIEYLADRKDYIVSNCGVFATLKEAKKAGMSYGKWESLYGDKIAFAEEQTDAPIGWKVCEYCGNTFKAKHNGQRFCQQDCQRHAYYEKNIEKFRENNRKYIKIYREKAAQKQGA